MLPRRTFYIHQRGSIARKSSKGTEAKAEWLSLPFRGRSPVRRSTPSRHHEAPEAAASKNASVGARTEVLQLSPTTEHAPRLHARSRGRSFPQVKAKRSQRMFPHRIFTRTYEDPMPTENCVCGLQTGRQCTVHPDRMIEFRTMFPSSSPGEIMPVAPKMSEEAMTEEWNDAQAQAKVLREARRG